MTTRRPAGVAALVVMFGICGVAAAAESAPPTPADLEFFEAAVRPLLLARCIGCHGPEKQQGQVRLDSRAAAIAEGAAGRVVVPGDPSASRLLQVIAFDPLDTQMPPSGKLPEAEIAVLTQWIARGAPWPAADVTAQAAAKPPAEEHWAFQPVQQPTPPERQDAAAVRTPIDSFIEARLTAAGLPGAPPADRRTLLRRASFDLLGIPPTSAQVAAFAADAAPDAWERTVDGLLASPLYGQRWGRHWLDVARYADTKGYVFVEDINYPYAYTYRDYVVASLNADKPYDRFVTEQLAADRLGLPEQSPDLAAMGFLTLGRRFLKNGHDIIDDRIDVTTRGLMGLTVTCARCHDHKYDPIPTADYYSLYGVFDSSVEPPDAELPEIGHPAETEEFHAYQAELAKRLKNVDDFMALQKPGVQNEVRLRANEYLRNLLGLPSTGTLNGSEELTGHGVQVWREHLAAAADLDPLWGPWKRLWQLPSENFEAAARAQLEQLAAEPVFQTGPGAFVLEMLRSEPMTAKDDLARLYGMLLTWTVTRPADFDPSRAARLDEFTAFLAGAGPPVTLTDAMAETFFYRAPREDLRERRKQVDLLRSSSPVAPPRAMVLRDLPNPHEVGIFRRGQPGNRGDIVPRRFLECLSIGERQPFTDGSGRLEMARRIADPANPLTARVLVNRVWMHHFGEGLVCTPSDFGTRADPPTHPQLLDWLAADFVQHGWSIKHLHRTILLSSVYQQSSEPAPELATTESAEPIDPENKLLQHFNRRRLEFEPLRDSMLMVAGRLDASLTGKPVDIVGGDTPRRSVYGRINRNDIPGLLRSFDVASPDVSTGQRSSTTVPQQALFELNSPFVQAQARALAARPEVAAAGSPAETVRQVFQIALQRDPSDAERTAAVAFLAAPQPAGMGLGATAQLAQVLMLTNEFNFVE